MSSCPQCKYYRDQLYNPYSTRPSECELKLTLWNSYCKDFEKKIRHNATCIECRYYLYNLSSPTLASCKIKFFCPLPRQAACEKFEEK